VHAIIAILKPLPTGLSLAIKDNWKWPSEGTRTGIKHTEKKVLKTSPLQLEQIIKQNIKLTDF